MNIKIRAATVDDATKLLKIYSYYVENTAVSFEYEIPTLDEFKSRITHILEKYPYLVADCEGKIVGYAYANAFKDREAYKFSVELTIYLEKDYRGRGIGKKLYTALEYELNMRGIKNLYACIAFAEVEDEFLTLASVKFHERLGFKICGKFTNCGFKFNR